MWSAPTTTTGGSWIYYVIGAEEGQGDLRDEEPQGRGQLLLQPLEDHGWIHRKFYLMYLTNPRGIGL